MPLRYVPGLKKGRAGTTGHLLGRVEVTPASPALILGPAPMGATGLFISSRELRTMTLYINVSLSEHGVLETKRQIQTIGLRAHATELMYVDATYLQAKAMEQWPDLEWRVEHVRAGRYIVKGGRDLHAHR